MVASRFVRPKTVAVDVGAEAPPEPREWPVPWWLVAVLGPIAVLLAGWLLLAGIAVVGWLTAPDVALGSSLLLASRILLLAHGAPADVGGQLVSIAPLGLSLTIVFLSLPISSFAARQYAAQGGVTDDTGQIWADTEAATFRVGGIFAGVYALIVVLGAAVMGSLSWRAVIGGITVGLIAGLWGAARGVDHSPTKRWPAWLRAVPRAMLASVLCVLIAASLALAAALWSGRDHVAELVAGLEPGVVGTILLVLLHLAYLPNLVLACASWLLGAGVTVGDGSIVTVTLSDVGLLPAIPAFGIVPEPGTAGPAMLVWLLAGVVAGVVAAVGVALARPRARFDETALVGGLAGSLAGLLVAVACSLGSGGLGVDRLAHVGARGAQLLVFAPTILGLAGLLAGLVVGLVRRREPKPVG